MAGDDDAMSTSSSQGETMERLGDLAETVGFRTTAYIEVIKSKKEDPVTVLESMDDFFDHVLTLAEVAASVAEAPTTTPRGGSDKLTKMMEETLLAVKGMVAAQQVKTKSVSPTGSTWAQVAAQSDAYRTASGLREVKVRVADDKEKKELWQTPNKEILRRVSEKTQGAVGVKKLPSGDISVQLKDRKAQAQATQAPQWVGGVSKSARILPSLFPVFVHGVEVS